MKKKLKLSSNKGLLIFSILILCSLIYIPIIYFVEFKPIFQDQEDLIKLVDFRPEISKKSFLGKENAPITVTAYYGFDCDSCNKNYNSLYNHLLTDYINKGIIKYYHKPLLLPLDISEKNQNYEITKFLDCIEKEKPEEYWFYHDNLLQNLTNFNFSISKDCVNTELLNREAEENLFFGLIVEPTLFIGIKGQDNTIITGIPSVSKLRRTIRYKEISLGFA
jgi:hypothetical protein